MRVVYVSTVAGGGTLTHLFTLAPTVAALGVEVRVACATDAAAAVFRRAGVDACAVPIRHKLDAVGAARLRPVLRGADIVHTHDRRAGWFARPMARVVGARVVHTLHGLPEEIAARVGRLNAPLPPGVSALRAAWHQHGYLRLETALAHLGAVVTPSHAMAEFLRAAGLPGERLRVIPHAIDVRRSEPRPHAGPLVLGVVAQLEYWKGIDVLLAACHAVRRPLRLEIFGGGSLRAELQAEAARLSIPVRFHGHVADVRSYLDGLDVFVLPSRAENLPVSIMEAMAHALPVIATHVGGVPEIVEDGVSGILVEPDDSAALACAISALADQPERAVRLGRNGARRAAQEFNAGVLAPRMVGLYDDLLSGRALGSAPVRGGGRLESSPP
jgi:glycosyltransferase involved in cell wall biosynthesis